MITTSNPVIDTSDVRTYNIPLPPKGKQFTRQGQMLYIADINDVMISGPIRDWDDACLEWHTSDGYVVTRDDGSAKYFCSCPANRYLHLWCEHTALAHAQEFGTAKLFY